MLKSTMGKRDASIRNRLATPVFIYDDYVDYLSAWYRYAKKFRLTQRAFMERTGAGPQAYFSDILARRKKLAIKHIPGFVAALELVGDAAEFFSLLVRKEHARIGAEKEQVLKQLSRYREKHLSTLVTDGNAEYFSSWKYPVVREYIVSRGYVSSLKEIQRAFLHFSMPLEEVRRTVSKLIQWKMVIADPETGGLQPGPGLKTITYDGMPHAVVNDVKRLFIESSMHAMETLPAQERHVTMAVRGISREKYERFCRKIDELRKDFLMDDDQGNAAANVCGLNVQLFPLMSMSGRGEADERDTVEEKREEDQTDFPPRMNDGVSDG
jgi:uncharacterized protein (TIGR02147 family)